GTALAFDHPRAALGVVRRALGVGGVDRGGIHVVEEGPVREMQVPATMFEQVAGNLRLPFALILQVAGKRVQLSGTERRIDGGPVIERADRLQQLTVEALR